MRRLRLERDESASNAPPLGVRRSYRARRSQRVREPLRAIETGQLELFTQNLACKACKAAKPDDCEHDKLDFIGRGSRPLACLRWEEIQNMDIPF